LFANLGKKTALRAETNEGLARVYGIVTAAIPTVLLFLSFISLIGDSYNPFLYSQF
jgi:hypothetical protein